MTRRFLMLRKFQKVHFASVFPYRCKLFFFLFRDATEMHFLKFILRNQPQTYARRSNACMQHIKLCVVRRRSRPSGSFDATERPSFARLNKHAAKNASAQTANLRADSSVCVVGCPQICKRFCCERLGVGALEFNSVHKMFA